MVKIGELQELVRAYENYGKTGCRLEAARALLGAAASLFDVVDFGEHRELRATLTAIRGAMATTKHVDVLRCLERALSTAEVLLADAMVRHIEAINEAA